MIIKRLRESRELLDLKQKEIAEILKVDFTTVSGWETGKDTIPLERLIEYANRFNYSLDYLFGITKQNTEYDNLKINLELIGKNLRILRKTNNLTQKEVAEKINTNQSAYAHYENAINLIPTTFLYNLTKIYKPFSIDMLLGRKKKQ
ncbi:MAG: helix-turn-helix transcriptional regulator [bacterium]|nr:helix-turn-helix transcriptional regulator [bacterium]